MCPNGNADLTRSLIIKSAISIVSADGLDALTAGRLIKQAGISKGGLYHHFRMMSDVEEEVLEYLSTNLIMRINGYPKPGSLDEFVDTVEKQVFELLAAETETSRALFGFISATANRKSVQAILNKLLEDISLSRFYQLQMLFPAVAPVKLQSIVQVISTLQMGLMIRFFISGDDVTSKNHWKSSRSLIEGMLTPQNTVAETVPSERASVANLVEYQ